MNRNKLLEKIDEAIASENTSEPSKILLNEIKQELMHANDKEEIVEIVLKLFELFAIFVDVMGLD